MPSHEPSKEPNAHWLAFFSEVFRLAKKLDRIEAERAERPEAHK